MHRRAIVLSKVLLAAPLIAAGGGSAWYFWPTSVGTMMLAATPADVDASLRSAGITPQALAAAGVNAAGTTTLFADASGHLAENLPALQAAEAAVVSARRDVDSLERIVIAGMSTEEQRNALAAARAALASATASRTAARDALVAAAAAHLDPARAAALAVIRANRAWDQPVQYLVVERSEGERVDFREALAAVRIAGEQGVDPDQGAVATFNAWNGDGSVAAATTSLDTNLAGVTAAWAAALLP